MTTRRTVGRVAMSIMMLSAWAAALVAWQPRIVAGWGSDYEHACDNSTASQCVAYNSTVDVWFDAGFPNSYRLRALAVFDSQYTYNPDNNGEVIVYEVTTEADADAKFFSVPYQDNGSIAWGLCPNWAANGTVANHKDWCEPQLIKYNPERYPSSFDTWAEQRAVACHELGHVFGLRHREVSYCMNDQPAALDELGGHEMNCLKWMFPLVPPGMTSSDSCWAG